MLRSPVEIGILAYEALRTEALLTPKPGLVDRHNNGAHSDMNLELLLQSAEALQPYFVELVAFGCLHKTEAPAKLLLALRKIGLRAEEAMLEVTGGVNTHKGALFGLGLLCAAAGVLGEEAETERLCAYVAEMTRGITMREGKEKQLVRMPETLRWQMSGARGEAESGFFHARIVGLPAYFQSLQCGCSQEEASLRALLQLMTRLMDTNLLRRGGPSAVTFVQVRAEEILHNFSIVEVEKFDQELILANLSPGGSADCLAITLFLSSFYRGRFSPSLSYPEPVKAPWF
jgi:triphosphoribosyl-dephospho-CoA synthase